MLSDERMRVGTPRLPDVGYAGRTSPADQGLNVVVIPMLNGGSSADAWWFPSVRPILRASVRASDNPDQSVVEARLQMNRRGRILFALGLVLGATGVVVALAGLGIGLTPLAIFGGGVLLFGLVWSYVLLRAARSGTTAGFAVLDELLHEQTRPLKP